MKSITKIVYIVFTLTCFSLVQANTHVNDPYEVYNRHAYALNKTFDDVLLKPVASIYKGVVPTPIRSGVNNMYSNLGELPSFANNIFQGNAQGAGVTFFRFVINSTIGILGFFDVASSMGIKQQRQDLGLTFAKWGVKDSPYLVIPFFGPKTVRDGFAVPFDLHLSIYPYLNNVKFRNLLFAGSVLNARTQLLEADTVMKQAALDPYVFQRDAYLQFRQHQINHNDGLEAKDPFDDLEHNPLPPAS